MDNKLRKSWGRVLGLSISMIVIACVYAIMIVGFWASLIEGDWSKDSAAASWAQALGTLTAVLVAVFTVMRQHSSDQRRERDRDAEAVLSLQMFANELQRMCALSLRQADEIDAPQFYPSLPGVFEDFERLLDKLSLERLAATNCLFAFLELRRIAVEMRILMESAPLPRDRTGQFSQEHLNRVRGLMDRARHHSLDLSKTVEHLSPGKYKPEHGL